MAKYIPYDDDETCLIGIHFKAQLQRGSFEYALNDLVENQDERFKRLMINDDIVCRGELGNHHNGTIMRADTGLANKNNMKYCHENNINALSKPNA